MAEALLGVGLFIVLVFAVLVGLCVIAVGMSDRRTDTMARRASVEPFNRGKG